MAHSGFRRPDAQNSEAVEDYAKAIHALAKRSDGPVTTSALAERLGRLARIGDGDAQAHGRDGARRARALSGRDPDRRGGARRARGHAPPPSARVVPDRRPRHAVGPRARRGRGARALHLRGAGGADRGRARRSDATTRTATRSRTGSSRSRPSPPSRSPRSRSAAPAPWRGCPTRIRPCCASSPRGGSGPARSCECTSASRSAARSRSRSTASLTRSAPTWPGAC